MKIKILLSIIVATLIAALLCIFVDEAVFVRKGSVYRVKGDKKLVALTFDDGPSDEWTPKILDALKQSGVKATFFMLGKHVEKFPQIAKRVADEGHEIGNHTYNHHVIMSLSLQDIESEIRFTEAVIKKVTGQTTQYFRPPKAYVTAKERKMIEGMGYKVVLWSLNSKDWVTFDDRIITNFLVLNIKPGDIILFHDSGGVFKEEGGNREETVKTIGKLVKALTKRGYKFVTISELLKEQG
jgi:peptidoglycan-N-acetylglucosamine deacetylase